MKLIALIPVRNEDWVLAISLRAALRWCDEVVVLLHACTDRSAAIVGEVSRENPFRVTVLDDSGETWNEMPQRQRMLQAARMNGATHIAIVDADEILTGNLIDGIKRDVSELPAGWLLELPGYNLRSSLTRYHTNGIWGNRWFANIFVDHPSLSWTGDQFHHREPFGIKQRTKFSYQHGNCGILHLWGASERRLIAKHRLYKITERLRWPEKPAAEIERMYSWATKGELGNPAYGTPETWTYAECPWEWWKPYADLVTHVDKDANMYLDLHAVPWQEAECARLIALHGADKFTGLDLS